MNPKHHNIALNILKLINIILICQALSVTARSVQRIRLEEKDPMMALPTGDETQQAVQYVTYQQAAGPYVGGAPAQVDTRQEIQVVEYQPQSPASMVGQPGSQPEEQYEVVQIQGQPQYQQQPSRAGGEQAVVPHTHDGIDCNQRHEFTALLASPRATESQEAQTQGGEPISSEYPGQLVYVGQGNNNDGDSVKNVAASWSQASDLSATILTEIPVKDMPHEVLRKLKRDYGVKVVATREMPGANLVINCDEYTGQESSICNRAMVSQEVAYQPQPMHSRAGAQAAVVESDEAVVMMPPPTTRHHQQVHSFQHVEHVYQPTSEPSHVYVREGPASESQPGSDGSDEPRGGAHGAEHSSPAAQQAGGAEHSGHEERMSEQTGGAMAYENHNNQNQNNNNNNNENENSHNSHRAAKPETSQADEQNDANAEHPNQQQAAARGQEGSSYELGNNTGFDESQPQKGAEEQSQPPQDWHQQHRAADSATDGREHTMRRDTETADWATPEDEPKQVEPTESYSNDKQTAR